MAKTPAEKWKQLIIKHRKKCQKVLTASDRIRYVGVINSHGRTLTGISREGVRPMLNPEDAKNEFFVIRMLLDLRKYPSSPIGVMDHVLLHHSKISLLILQKGAVMYYISLSKGAHDVEDIVAKIKKII